MAARPAGFWGRLPPRPWWLHSQLGRQRFAASGPASARSGGNLSIQTRTGQSGPGAPARSNARLSRPPAPASEPEPAASVTAEQHRRLGLQALQRARRAEAMEHSRHRVSLASRRVHPGLSFYLTTFGKCLLRLAARAAAPCSQGPDGVPTWC